MFQPRTVEGHGSCMLHLVALTVSVAWTVFLVLAGANTVFRCLCQREELLNDRECIKPVVNHGRTFGQSASIKSRLLVWILFWESWQYREESKSFKTSQKARALLAALLLWSPILVSEGGHPTIYNLPWPRTRSRRTISFNEEYAKSQDVYHFIPFYQIDLHTTHFNILQRISWHRRPVFFVAFFSAAISTACGFFCALGNFPAACLRTEINPTFFERSWWCVVSVIFVYLYTLGSPPLSKLWQVQLFVEMPHQKM